LSSPAPGIIVVSAPSGAGKSTALRRVLREAPGLRFSVSHTTRAPRAGERDGVEYHFVDRACFEGLKREGRMLEWAEVHGELYGTAHAELERAAADGVDLLLDLDVQGAAQVRLKRRDAVTVFILPPSFAALEARLRGRGLDDEASIRRRLLGARDEMSLYGEYDYAVVNDDLESCVASLKAIVAAARCRTARMRGPADAILDSFDSQRGDQA
jgi:guanylate kinase